jgi:hypothetical protein
MASTLTKKRKTVKDFVEGQAQNGNPAEKWNDLGKSPHPSRGWGL